MKLVLCLLLCVLVVPTTDGAYWQRNRKRKGPNSNSSDTNSTYQDYGKPEDFGLDRHGNRAPYGINFVSNSCPADAGSPPTCVVGRPGNETAGAWVCRTLFDIVTGVSRTFSACVETTRFLSTDKCGCCGGVCPSVAPCGCACNLTKIEDHRFLKGGSSGGGGNSGGGDDAGGDNHGGKGGNGTGVLVTIVSTTQCVPVNASIKLVTGAGFFGPASCVTVCP